MDDDYVDEKTAGTFRISDVLIPLLLIIIISAFINFKWKQRNLEKAAAKIPGPPALPIIGNALELWCHPRGMYNIFFCNWFTIL